MKKFIKISAFAIIAGAFLFSSVVRAETGYAPGYGEPVKTTTGTTIKVDANGKLAVPIVYPINIDVKTKAELEAIYKAQIAKCDGLTEEKKLACIKASEEAFQMGLRKIMNFTQASVDAKKILEQKMIEGKIITEGKIGPGETKETKDSGEVKPTTPRGFASNFHAMYGNYFKRVVLNLDAIFERISTLADRVESRLEKLEEQGIETDASVKLLASARAELKLAKVESEAAVKAFETESKNPIKGQAVVNSNGVTITTGEEEYNKCVSTGGKLDENDKNRCWTDEKHVYANPDAQTLVILMVSQIRDKKSSFPETLKHIAAAKVHFKAAHRFLAQAISSIKPGINDEVKVNAGTTEVIKTNVQGTVEAN